MPIAKALRTTKSTETTNGRYVQGGTTDVYKNRLGWWDRREFSSSVDDLTVVVDPATAGRPDLIAYDVYNKSTLMWFVLQYNNIVDVQEELVAGKILTLPTPSRLFSSLLTSAPGGRIVR